MRGIFLKCDDYILNIFENLEKATAIEVFDFLTNIEYLTQIEKSRYFFQPSLIVRQLDTLKKMLLNFFGVMDKRLDLLEV